MKSYNVKIIAIVLAFLCNMFIHASLTQASDDLYTAIREGKAVAMMRHAIAPGGGDPSDFKLRDCSTQRNLSQEGRDQAERIGKAFRDNGIVKAEVLTSQWCRCIDTAAQLALGEFKELPALNSFFESRENGPAQTESLRQFLLERKSNVPLVLVTHQVNVTAFTGVFPGSGEVVVFTLSNKGVVEVLGSL